jgi:hypothetical protein
MEEKLIAPCGMNCAVCVAHLAMKLDLKKQGFGRMYCPGCLPRGKNCVFMANKCQAIGNGLYRFCFECPDYPCHRLKNLDKRYRTKYHLSMIENLNAIKASGIGLFLGKEEAKWRCPNCDGVICCHNGLCLKCDLEILHRNKKYRWGE